MGMLHHSLGNTARIQHSLRFACASLLLAALGGLAPCEAGAQTRYTCRDDNGNNYTSFRACPQGMKTTSVSAGPTASEYRAERSSSRSVPSSPAPDHQQYMSERCRTLNDTMRSAYSRGIKADVQDGMRREYNRDCRDEESEASSRYDRERREARQQQRDEDRQVQQAQQASQADEARRGQQCAESRRILHLKKTRTDLTEGERNDLKRFEDAYLARCAR
ncbi:MAG: hypothetical protein V4679_00280 [Pseudomonadota bacterium]